MIEGSVLSAIVQDHSVLGRTWALAPACEHQIQRVMSSYGVSELVARLLVARDVPFDHIPQFLDPRLIQDMPDPCHLLDMERGIQRIYRALQNKESITLWGDYDVDGATSTSLLYRFLNHHTDRVNFYIPDRFREGYGPNISGFQRLCAQGANVIITLDCGTTSYDSLAYACTQGVDVIVIDHHGLDAGALLPPAYAVINPNRPDETSTLKPLAAVGLTFLFVVALNRLLRNEGWYQIQEPYPLMALLDLVALGTVCDVVPLTGLNRTFVRQGLKVLAQTQNRGLRALTHHSGLEQAHTPYHCGFVLGPRVNAGGRIGEADLGTRLLVSSDDEEMQTIAQHLNILNTERQGIESCLIEEALVQARAQDQESIVIVSGQGWHEGVIGIIAGRLKELVHKPTLVITWSHEGKGKGSGRSVPGIDLGHMIRLAVQQGLLTTGGGHAMAAGLSLTRDQHETFCHWVRDQVSQKQKGEKILPPLMVDAVMHIHSLNLKTLDALMQLEPFGAGHPQPRCLVRGLRMRYATLVGKQHVRCVFAAASTHGGGGELQGIAFRAVHSSLGEALLHTSPSSEISIVGTLHKNTWQNRDTLQMHIEDAMIEKT